MNRPKDMEAFLPLALTTPFLGTYSYEHVEEWGISITAQSWGEYGCRHFIIPTRHLLEDKQRELLQLMVDEEGMKETPTCGQVS